METNQNANQGGSAGDGTTQTQGSGATPQIDYEKLASIVAEKQSATEDTALKNYFKQQGLSQDEMGQAIAAFKQQKAQNTPDVAVLQQQATQAQTALQKAQIENAAILEALGLGLDAKTIPYALKMADMSGAIGQDGKIDNKILKEALEKVLEDIPALKPQQQQGTGFVQVGASSSGKQVASQQEQLASIFGNKK